MNIRIIELACITFLGFSITGCVSAEERQVAFERHQLKKAASIEKETSLKAEIIKTTPKCQTQSDCTSKMEAAYLWVSKNADYKIRSSNGVMIETYTPNRHDKDFGVSVEKTSLGNGKYAIVATMACGVPNQNPMTDCGTNLLDKTIEFNKFVNGY
jgi:hypothetical protein